MRGKNIEGLRFGRLVAVSRTSKSCPRGVYWLCRCDCDEYVEVLVAQLNSKAKQSCGCLHLDSARNKHIKHRSHGLHNSPTYKTWKSMLERCRNPANSSYKYYGAKGISVCDEWLNSFKNFLDDMGVRPNGTTLDRINNSEGYSKTNCKWSTYKEQARNRRTTVKIHFDGNELTLSEYATLVGLSYSGARFRVRKHFQLVNNVYVEA